MHRKWAGIFPRTLRMIVLRYVNKASLKNPWESLSKNGKIIRQIQCRIYIWSSSPSGANIHFGFYQYYPLLPRHFSYSQLETCHCEETKKKIKKNSRRERYLENTHVGRKDWRNCHGKHQWEPAISSRVMFLFHMPIIHLLYTWLRKSSCYLHVHCGKILLLIFIWHRCSQKIARGKCIIFNYYNDNIFP